MKSFEEWKGILQVIPIRCMRGEDLEKVRQIGDATFLSFELRLLAGVKADFEEILRLPYEFISWPY
jgi:hypothetical protein